MTLQLLRTFLAVWRLGSITRAATSLGLTQPAVSGQIKSLEGLLEAPLFERTSRGVRPTAVADALARSLGSSLDEAESAFEAFRVRSCDDAEPVILGLPAELTGSRVASALNALTDAGVPVNVRVGGQEKLSQMLQNGDVEIAITAPPPSASSVSHTPIAGERLIFAAPPAMARAARSARTANAVNELNWVGYNNELPLARGLVQRQFGVNLTATPVVTAPNLILLRDLVVSGVGVTVLPEYLCGDAIAAGKIVDVLDGEGPLSPLYLAWRQISLRTSRIAMARRILLTTLGDGNVQDDIEIFPQDVPAVLQ